MFSVVTFILILRQINLKSQLQFEFSTKKIGLFQINFVHTDQTSTCERLLIYCIPSNLYLSGSLRQIITFHFLFNYY